MLITGGHLFRWSLRDRIGKDCGWGRSQHGLREFEWDHSEVWIGSERGLDNGGRGKGEGEGAHEPLRC